MRARPASTVLLLALCLGACGHPAAHPARAKAPIFEPPPPTGAQIAEMFSRSAPADDDPQAAPTPAAPSPAKIRPPTGCELAWGELPPSRPADDPALPPDLKKLVHRIRSEGFNALPAIWDRLRIEETDLRDRGDQPCFDDDRSCLEVLGVSASVGSLRYAVLRLSQGFTLADDGSRIRKGEGALLLVFATTATASRFVGYVSSGDAEENWGGLPVARVVQAGDRAFLAVKTAPHCGTGCLYLPERWFDLAQALPGPLHPVLTFLYGGHTVPMVPYYDREFKAEVVAVAVGARGGAPYVEVAVTACHLGPTSPDIAAYYSDGDPVVAFTRRGKARFGWSERARTFVIEPGPGRLDEQGLASFSGDSYRSFVEHAFPELRAVAMSSSPTRPVLREFLERHCFAETGDDDEPCRESPRAIELYALLPP